jgi:hypothetical protein
MGNISSTTRGNKKTQNFWIISPEIVRIPWGTRPCKGISLKNRLRVDDLDLKSSQVRVECDSPVDIKSRNFETT